MNIGIDIDDTITITSEPIREYMERFSREYLGDDTLSDHITDLMRGRLSDDLVKKFYLENIFCIEAVIIFSTTFITFPP